MRTIRTVSTVIAGMMLWLSCTAFVVAFIETAVPLKNLLADADHIFLAKVEKVDAAKPGAILAVEKDLKGKAPYRRLAINLTGDKEKHTPQLLKRLAPDVPIVVFVLEEDKRFMGLAFTNGTWFQILGHKDGDAVRWEFTHCEIYLRRTFKGTTAELQQVIVDGLTNKKAPPPHNPKEPPGFGPEIESKKCDRAREFDSERAIVLAPSQRPTLGVIVLPFAMPIAALLQLLFPGILRKQWREYKVAVYVLLSQSTLLFAHYAIWSWCVNEPEKIWWLRDSVLWAAMVLVTLGGALAATIRLWRSSVRRGQIQPAEAAHYERPTRVEYIALGTLVVAGLGWGGWQYWTQEPPFRDEMAVVFFGALLGLGHLVYRRWVSVRTRVTTELAFLWGMVLAGAGLGYYVYGQPQESNQLASQVQTDWPLFRGNPQRTGALEGGDPGPRQPRILWTFQPGERKGRVTMHSSPTFASDQVYVGALHEVLSLARGRVYCINAADGRMMQDHPVKGGERLWNFAADDTLKPVFASPTLANGRIYIGEGYHQDQRCRLLCLDPSSGQMIWAKQTDSHVESSPCVVGSRVYFGAGDDGIFCVDEAVLESGPGTSATGVSSPKTVWQLRGFHIDSSPLVVGDLLFAGSVIGDIHRELAALAVDIHSGQVAWRVPASMPVPGSPAYAEGRIFFGLGNGKMTDDAENPRGAVWCLDAKTGQRLWQFDPGNSVLATPTLDKAHVYFGARNGTCYCLRQQDGEIVWKKDLNSPIVASLTLAAGKLYGITTSGNVFCLDAADGRELWHLDDLQERANGEAVASPFLAKGRLYVAVGGQVYCIGDP